MHQLVFGKTYCIFEYIAKYKPNNVVLVVPTLALVDEYRSKIIKKYKNKFKGYKIYTNIDIDKEYNFNGDNIFILTHDKVVQEDSYTKIEHIDFLVVDEVYKLEKDVKDDRILVLNMAYYHMSKKAKKYVLLAPFINSVIDVESLEKKPKLYKTEYSPVVNTVEKYEIEREEDRFNKCKEILEGIGEDEKTLIYFPSVTGIYSYINKIIAKEKILLEPDETVKHFIEWAKSEIHEDWSLVKALERGYLIHNGQLPIGSRIFQMNFYENNNKYNRMLCTSTLLEGVNTISENIIITKASRRSNSEENFSAFDFFNLVGRTGRLNKHLLGKAFYIKGPNDIDYKKIDAIKDIKFELTDESIDIDIQMGKDEEHNDYLDFLKELGISQEEYKKNLGTNLRFDTVKKIYERYSELKHKLLKELQEFINDEKRGRFTLVSILYEIINGKPNMLDSNIINRLLNKNRIRIKNVINAVSKNKENNIDYIIATVIRMKMGYIEHEFYTRVMAIKFFMEKENIKKELIDKLTEKIISSIEYLYFFDSNKKKMLIEMGIYERDIEKILDVIGDDYEDLTELKIKLNSNADKIENISFISKYIIDNI